MQANVDSHKIFQCKLFTGGFVDKYKITLFLEVTHTNATGIPAHLVSAFNLEKELVIELMHLRIIWVSN